MKMNKKIQLAFLTLVVFVLLATGVYASATIDIEIKPEFTTGDTVSFNYTFVSDVDEKINYIVNVDCPYAPKPLLDISSAILEKNIPFKEEYRYIEVTEDIEPQNCSAVVGIIEPFNLSEEKSFEIVTDPSFEFEAFLCEDQSCIEKSKVFVRNSDVYLDYYSEVENPSVTATLTSPDKSTKQITLPTSIRAEQIGTYTLEVTASKEGYKKITKKSQFGVIEKEADIRSESRCNANGICEEGENEQNCPQDCVRSEEQAAGWGYLLYLLYIALIIIVIVIVILVINHFRKPQPQPPVPYQPQQIT